MNDAIKAIIDKQKFKYMPTLKSGYYNPYYGWHRLKSSEKNVYNWDETGRPFFNKV